jgi:hypothetical protein
LTTRTKHEKNCQWSEAAMIAAIEAVRQQGISQREALKPTKHLQFQDVLSRFVCQARLNLELNQLKDQEQSLGCRNCNACRFKGKTKKGTAKKTQNPAETDCTPCGVCGIIYCDDHSSRNWIECSDCKTWYHNACQGLEENCILAFVCISCACD